MIERAFSQVGLTFHAEPPLLDSRHPLIIASRPEGDGYLAVAALEIERFHIPERARACEADDDLSTSWRGAADAIVALQSPSEFWHVISVRDSVGADGSRLRTGWVGVGRGVTVTEAGFEAERVLRSLHAIYSAFLNYGTLRPVSDPPALLDLVRFGAARFIRAVRRRRWQPPIGVLSGDSSAEEARDTGGVWLPWTDQPGSWAPLAEALALRTAPTAFAIRVVTGFDSRAACAGAEADLVRVADAREAVLGRRLREVVALHDAAGFVIRAASDRLRSLSGSVLAADALLASDDTIDEGTTAIAVAALGRRVTAHSTREGDGLPATPLITVDLESGSLWQSLRVVDLPETIVGVHECAAILRTANPPLDERSPLPCSRARVLPLRTTADKGVVLGDAEQLGAAREVRLDESARFQHVYVVGQTGTGKSTLLLNMILQDIEDGRGVTIIDPHGPLIDGVLARLPPERSADVVVVDPAYSGKYLGLNPLEVRATGPEAYVAYRDRLIDELMDTFSALYDMNITGGPMFEQSFRTFVTLVAGGTAPPAYRPLLPMVALAMQDPALARKLGRRLQADDPVTAATLETVLAATGDAALRSMAPYVTSKLTRFYAPAAARRMLCQPDCFDFDAIIRERRIVLVQLSRALLGRYAATLIARQIVLRLTLAAVARGTMPSGTPHFLYVDEFHYIATEQFAELLAEARKFRFGLVLAHQYTSQLVKRGERHVLDAVLGNVGTTVSFRIGAQDAELLENVMTPRVKAADIVGLPDYAAYVRSVGSLGNVPFTLTTRLPTAGADPAKGEAIRLEALERHGMPRGAVDAVIGEMLKAFREMEA
jgi:hypothetical protein